MIFDPMYFLFILPGLALSIWASVRVKSTFNKYSKVRSMRGLTGAEAAQVYLALPDEAGQPSKRRKMARLIQAAALRP